MRIIKYIVIVSFFICCIFSCGRVKNESVRVIHPDSISYSFVIQVNEAGNYLVYIPDESERIKSSQLIPSKISISDSIWAVQLTDIDICIIAYKKPDCKYYFPQFPVESPGQKRHPLSGASLQRVKKVFF